MKKFAAFAVIAGLLSVAAAQPASAQVLDVDAGDLTAGVFPDEQLATLESSGSPFAVGGGMTALEKFAFAAHLGSNGKPSGYAVLKGEAFFRPEFEVQGRVDCYVAGGLGAAQFGIEIDEKRSSGLTGAGGFITFDVVDSEVEDTIKAYRTAVGCTPALPFALGPVIRGNIVVRN